MRILLVHPNYHSGGAEIAGNWPPAWAAYLAGALKGAGFGDVQFLDAMTNNLDDAAIRAEMARIAPDVVGVTSITPSIYAAEEVLKIAQEVVPDALRMLGGIHATFMYRQVLTEAPWIDVIVRGEGEEILVALMTAVKEGRWPADRGRIKGLAFRDGTEIVATQAAPTVRITTSRTVADSDESRWSVPTHRLKAFPGPGRSTKALNGPMRPPSSSV